MRICSEGGANIIRLPGEYDGNPRTHDACLVPDDIGQRRSEDVDMFHFDSSNNGHYGAEVVCGIESAAQPGFDHAKLDLTLAEGNERRCGQQFKGVEAAVLWLCSLDQFNHVEGFSQQTGKRFVGDSDAVNGNALIPTLEMGGSEAACRQSAGPQDG